jgi:hypothetical protein
MHAFMLHTQTLSICVRVECENTRSNLEAITREKAKLETNLASSDARAKELDRALKEGGKRASAAALVAASNDGARAVLEKRVDAVSSQASAALSVSVSSFFFIRLSRFQFIYFIFCQG